jgi:hypothetical protein
MRAFQVVALDAASFVPYFAMTAEELRSLGAGLVTADEKPGFPCRVSLADAEIGETVLSLPYVHHDVATPYRSSGPIFVREGAVTALPAVGEIPAMLVHRLLSLRAYDPPGHMVDSRVIHGTEIEPAIEAMFDAQSVGYIHVHNAGPGCYNCRIERARG